MSTEGEESREFDEEEDCEDVEYASMLQTLLITEDGTSIADIMHGIKEGIDKQNKIFMKIGGILEKYFSNQA